MQLTVMVTSAIALVIVLAGVAIYYQFLVCRKRNADRQVLERNQIKQRERQLSSIESIEIIARTVLAGQVTLTEASIRINALMQSLNLNGSVKKELAAFAQLAEATAHIPILEKWKALSRKQQRDFDFERERIENDFRDFVIAAAAVIVNKKILIVDRHL